MKTTRIGWKIVDYEVINKYFVHYRKALLKLEILGPVVTPHKKIYLVPYCKSSEFAHMITKFRTSKVRVLAAWPVHYSGKTGRQFTEKNMPAKFMSSYKESFWYKTGKVRTTELDIDANLDCASGIHFFAQRRHACWWI